MKTTVLCIAILVLLVVPGWDTLLDEPIQGGGMAVFAHIGPLDQVHVTPQSEYSSGLEGEDGRGSEKSDCWVLDVADISSEYCANCDCADAVCYENCLKCRR